MGRSAREKLVRNRLTAPLYDSDRYVRYAEVAYTRMIERHRAGLPPESFDVPADVA